MTENEAISELEKFQLQIEHSIVEENCCEYTNSEKALQEDKKFLDAFNIAISAIKEIQQYRAIGTVEEVQNQRHNLDVAYKIISDYESVGSVEECREAVEKQKPMRTEGRSRMNSLMDQIIMSRGEMMEWINRLYEEYKGTNIDPYSNDVGYIEAAKNTLSGFREYISSEILSLKMEREE